MGRLEPDGQGRNWEREWAFGSNQSIMVMGGRQTINEGNGSAVGCSEQLGRDGKGVVPSGPNA